MCRQHVPSGWAEFPLLLGQVQTLAKSAGSYRVLSPLEMKRCLEDAHGRYGMWSYPNENY